MSEYSDTFDIPPLEERCSRYILSIILSFLRQTAPAEPPLILPSKTSDITFREFETEPVGQPDIPTDNVTVESANGNHPHSRPQTSLGSVLSGQMSINSTIRIPSAQIKYEKTHMSLVKSRTAVTALITEYSGRIIFSISMSNWSTVFERLRSKIRALANKPEETEDLTDLQLLAYIVFDRLRLIQILNGESSRSDWGIYPELNVFLFFPYTELSSLLVNMCRESQLAIAIPLRSAIWNWIEYHPKEFREVVQTRGRTEGAPERVFDLLFSKMKIGDERTIWPTLTALCSMISERLATDHIQYSGKGFKPARKVYFLVSDREDICAHSVVGPEILE
jgi:neurofibromin 1